MGDGWHGAAFYRNGQWLGSYSKSYLGFGYTATWHSPCEESHPMNEFQANTIDEAKLIVETNAKESNAAS